MMMKKRKKRIGEKWHLKINYVDTPQKSLITLGLCYGRGGLDRGLERGIRSFRNSHSNEETNWSSRILQYAAHVEIESFAAYNLVAQMEQGVLAPAPVWTDLKTFPWEQFYKKIHILTGGYPCQPFSQAGLQAGVTDPRHLFPFIEHGIDSVRPVLCFFENVANHLNIGYREVRQRISSLGYKIEADIFAAEQVGATHLRKRLFILAVADTYCTEQSKRRGDLAEVLGLSQQQSWPDNGAAISRGDRKETLADTQSTRLQRRDRVERTIMPSYPSSSLGDTNNQGEQQPSGTIGESGRRTDNSGKTVDHSFQSRLEGQSWNENAKKRWEDTVRSIASSSIWPAPQGAYQYGWEHPRLESSLGFTVNGFDFTTDLLRMEGNAVVEQQAELAFRTLLMKFL